MTENAQPGGSDPAPAEAVSTPASEVAQPENADTGAAPETGAEQPPADDAGADKPKKPGGVQKRIDELTAARQRAEREADFLRDELLRARQPAQPQQPKAEEIDVSRWVPPAPKPADFPAGEYDPNYLIAAARHGLQVDAARHAIRQQHQAMDAADRRVEQSAARNLDAGGERLGVDLRQVAGELARVLHPDIGNLLVSAAAESELGADVLHHYGTNRADAEALARMSPAAAARHIGRVEERLERARSAASVTNAPKPPATVGGGVSARPAYTAYDAPDMEAYVRARAGKS